MLWWIAVACLGCAGPCSRKEQRARQASELSLAAYGECRIEVQPLEGRTVVLTHAVAQPVAFLM